MRKNELNSKNLSVKDPRAALIKSGTCELQEGVKIERVNFQADKYTFVKKRAGYSGC